MTQNELKVNRPRYEHPACLFVSMDAADIICLSPTGTTEDFENLDDFVW